MSGQERIDRIVEALKAEWRYIDISRDPHYDDDWRELVRDVLRIASSEPSA